MKNNFYANVENEKIFARKIQKKENPPHRGGQGGVIKAFLYKSRNQNFLIIETHHFPSKYRLMVNQHH